MKRWIWIAALLAAVSAPASAKTWIVDDDGGPGVDFTEIQPAIDAAASGDLILVRDGDYKGFHLTKSLVLAADTGHRPRVTSASTLGCIITTAEVSGFDLDRLYLDPSTGLVVIDDCACEAWGHTEMMEIEHCALVLLSRCHVSFHHDGELARPCVKITESEVIFSECTILGQDGWDSVMSDPPGDGGDGIEAESSTLYVQATTCLGGAGGDYSG